MDPLTAHSLYASQLRFLLKFAAHGVFFALSVVMETLSKNYLANSLQAAVEMHGQKQHISGQKEKVTLQKKDHSADLFKKAVYFLYLYLFICIFDRNRAQLFSLANLHPQSLGRRHS